MSLRNSRFIYYKEIPYLVSRIHKRYQDLRNRGTGLIAGPMRKRLSREWQRQDPGLFEPGRLLKKIHISYDWDLAGSIPAKEKEIIIKQADRVLDGCYDLLGSGNMRLDLPDWHTDFKSGYSWKPGKFYRNYRQVSLENTADIKVVRELNRFHHLLRLGEAWLLTGEDKYTREFIRQVSHWIDTNPLLYSVNWSSTMDVAIRAVNWLYATAMFTCNQELESDFIKKIMNSLYEHGWHIFNNPEKNYCYSNNHYDADLAGLIFLGLVFSGTKRGKRWLRFAVRELFSEIRRQILPSGVSYERSIHYSRLVNELFTYPVIQLKKNNHFIPADILYRIEKQFEFTMNYSKPDGKTPVIGDQDNGRLLPFSTSDMADHRYLLTIGSIMFKRKDFKSHSAGFTSDALFLLGNTALKIFNNITADEKSELESKSFKDAGFFIMRNKGTYLFINNSGQGKYFDDPFSFASHTHADLLSFELFACGQTILTDPGTYLYTSSPEDRYLFRSTAMHNTVTVDEKNQYDFRIDQPFRYGSKANPKTIRWKTTGDYDLYIGEHNGYARLDDPVIHRRYFLFRKKENEIKIIDKISGNSEHNLSLHYQFNPGIDFTTGDEGVTVTGSKGVQIMAMGISDNRSNPFEFIKKTSWISPSYGIRTRNNSLEIRYNSVQLPLTVETLITIPDE